MASMPAPSLLVGAAACRIRPRGEREKLFWMLAEVSKTRAAMAWYRGYTGVTRAAGESMFGWDAVSSGAYVFRCAHTHRHPNQATSVGVYGLAAGSGSLRRV
jgi:hypothetical protein